MRVSYRACVWQSVKGGSTHSLFPKVYQHLGRQTFQDVSASLPVQIKTEIILVFVRSFVKTSVLFGYFETWLFFLLKCCCGGPWWYTSGQPACLLLRRSEFESRRRLIFFSVKVVFEKNKNKQKEYVFGPFFLKKTAVANFENFGLL